MTNEKAQIIIGNIPIKPEVLDDCYDITEYQEAKAMAIKALNSQPCGEWIKVDTSNFFKSNSYKCSICGNILNFDGVNAGRGDANFCPNCGAKNGRK